MSPCAVRRLLMLLAVAVLGSATAHAQDKVIPGRFEYLESCAACHGPNGKGDGPVAQFLKSQPTDLTTLSADNDGRFPFLKVFQFIDGRTLTQSHGSREMPIWGARYMAREQAPLAMAEELVQGRILGLVYYIHSLQGEASE